MSAGGLSWGGAMGPCPGPPAPGMPLSFAMPSLETLTCSILMPTYGRMTRPCSRSWRMTCMVSAYKCSSVLVPAHQEKVQAIDLPLLHCLLVSRS